MTVYAVRVRSCDDGCYEVMRLFAARLAAEEFAKTASYGIGLDNHPTAFVEEMVVSDTILAEAEVSKP